MVQIYGCPNIGSGTSISGLVTVMVAGLIGATPPLPAHAQQTNHLTCQGELQGAQATIVGVRQFEPTSSSDDGYVSFQGEIATGNVNGDIAYEGYTVTGSLPGQITAPQG